LKDVRAIKTNEMGGSRSTHEETEGYRVLVEKPEERAHYAHIDVDGSTILKRILKIEDKRAYTGEVWVTGET
jgi:hypothetical protein